MRDIQAPRRKLLYAAALVLILGWAWISPPQAFAQDGPVVTITSPASDSSVAGTVTVCASLSSGGSIQFKLDGVNLGPEAFGPSYQVPWDTTATSDGFHTLTAVARDANGLQFTSDSVAVTVSNGSNGSPSPTVTRVEETDPSITYTGQWPQADPRAWIGGTAAVAESTGAQATFAFTGTSVNWIGFRGPQTGVARVFLDGVLAADVDTYSPTEEVQAVLFVATSLANTSHTLTIVITGEQNANSIAAYIVVDAFDITP